jgi:hypothetical protein
MAENLEKRGDVGTLTLQPPANLLHRSRARRQKGYPLLDAAEEQSA